MIFVFDLDDTLYPELDFVKSGFWAIALHLAPDEPAETYQALMRLFREHGSGRVFDLYAEQQGRELDVADLVTRYRCHTPLIRLDVETRIVLERIRLHCRTGLVTDGPYAMQRNKYQALELTGLIDVPVFTDLLGTSKPDSRPFEIVMDLLRSDEYVYVADNPRKDFIAPQNLGWRTVRLRRMGGVYAHLPAEVDYEIGCLFELLDLFPPALLLQRGG